MDAFRKQELRCREKLKEVSETKTTDENQDDEEEEMKKLERLMKIMGVWARWSVGKGRGQMDRGGEKKVVLGESHFRKIEKT